MRDIVLAAEELNTSLLYRPNWFQIHINRFKYKLITKSVFKSIKEAFLSGEDEAMIRVPNNYRQKMLYEDVMEHFRFLGYEIDDTKIFYHIKWPDKQEQKNNKVVNNIEEDYFLCNSSLECLLKKRQLFNQIQCEKDKVIKNIKGGKGLRSI